MAMLNSSNKTVPNLLALTCISLLALSGCGNVEVAELGREKIPLAKPGEKTEEQIIDDISVLLRHNINEQYSDKEKFLRDTHPKANACLHATLTVDQAINPEYQKGVFQPGASYPLWMRFSNAVEEVTSDYEKDFRGLALKLTQVNGKRVSMTELSTIEGQRRHLPMGDELHTQDFLFLGHDAFFAANPMEFFEFFSMSFPRFAITHPRGAWNIFRGSRRVVTPLDIKWNSVTAYALGAQNTDGSYNHIVRYALQTCATNSGEQPSEDNPDYLGENLAKQLSGNGKACLDFYIQRQTDAYDMPVENALVAWDQKASPFIKIARINIPAQVFTSEAQKTFCENLSFNPSHSLVDHKPLGGINRARRVVMKDISDTRLKKNGVERVEPTGAERF